MYASFRVIDRCHNRMVLAHWLQRPSVDSHRIKPAKTYKIFLCMICFESFLFEKIKSKMSLYKRTVLITGASRGIGRAIALRCAEDGANVGIISRSGRVPSHESLDGTLREVACQIQDRGGNPFIMPLNVGNTTDVKLHVSKVLDKFGSIDAIVNNASAVYVETHPNSKQCDTMLNVNIKGTLNMILATCDELNKSDIGHILTISPPLHTLKHLWMQPHPTYTMTKYAMSMLTIGHGGNTLWPKKLVKTAATKMLEKKTGIPGYSRGGSAYRFAVCAHSVLCSDMTGESLFDVDVLPNMVDENGVDDIFI